MNCRLYQFRNQERDFWMITPPGDSLSYRMIYSAHVVIDVNDMEYTYRKNRNGSISDEVRCMSLRKFARLHRIDELYLFSAAIPEENYGMMDIDLTSLKCIKECYFDEQIMGYVGDYHAEQVYIRRTRLAGRF